MVLWTTWTLVKYKLMKKIIQECTKRGIFEEHREYVRAWLQYLDQKKFSKKLEKQMIEEVKIYLATRDSKILDHIIEIVWNEVGDEAWIIVVQGVNQPPIEKDGLK